MRWLVPERRGTDTWLDLSWVPFLSLVIIIKLFYPTSSSDTSNPYTARRKATENPDTMKCGGGGGGGYTQYNGQPEPIGGAKGNNGRCFCGQSEKRSPGPRQPMW